jgi:hypothetical protein
MKNKMAKKRLINWKTQKWEESKIKKKCRFRNDLD